MLVAILLLLLAAVSVRAQEGPGFALRFDGSGNYVAVPHTAGLNAFPITVMAWVQTTQSADYQGLVNKYAVTTFNGWNVFLRDGRVRAWYFVSGSRFVWDGGDGLDGGFVADGLWHHVAFVVDSTGASLYVDGVNRASRGWTGAFGFTTSTQELRLGNFPGGVVAFDGLLDEITVWRSALTQSQVQSNMNSSLTGTEPNLLLYFRCDEGGGSTVGDSAPLNGNNHGAWVGTPLFVELHLSVQTLPASAVSPTQATLNGLAKANRTSASAWFEWGNTTNYGNVTPPQALGSGNGPTNFSQVLTGLFGGIHHFRAVASNGLGVVLGGNESFTLQPPTRVVINELVKDRRSATGGQVAETREFVELYNAGTAAVNLSGWFVRTANLADGAEPFHIFIPAGTSLGPGSFYVIGQTGVPKVNLDLGTVELWTDARPLVLELRDNTETLVDAVACDLYRTNSLGSFATPEQIAQFGAGFYGNLISTDVAAPNAVQSWGRWLDGRDTDNNGRDLGIIPVTPGTANNLPQVLAHSVFDLSGLAHGSPVPGYFASFVMPRAIDPGTVDSVNPRAIDAPPGGGKAIIAWDHTGGGNATYSRELVRGFVLRVYLDTGPLGITGATASSTETTVYGIGTTDAFFNNPDPAGTIFTSDALLKNGSTGIGWLYQRRETTNGTGNFSKLFLVDFGPGGNPRPLAAGGSWNIIQELNVATLPPGWYRLNVHYDPPTGEVLAIFGDQTFIFTTAPGLLGTFCVGYRTAINNFANNLGAHDPPTFIVQSPPAPRPALLIERIAPTQVRLLWPTNAVGFTLQSNTNLNTTNWISAVAPPSVVSTNHVSLDSTTNRQRFYRLFHP